MNWSYAASVQDAHDLSEFVCTEAAPAEFGPGGDILELDKHWEYEVQVALQSAPVPPPLGDFILIGRDDAPGLAAAAWWGEIGTDGPGYIRLFCLAVALRLRRSGQYVGDALMTEAIKRIEDNAKQAGIQIVGVSARVDRDNADSQDMMQRHDFTYIQNDGWYQAWWRRLDIQV